MEIDSGPLLPEASAGPPVQLMGSVLIERLRFFQSMPGLNRMTDLSKYCRLVSLVCTSEPELKFLTQKGPT